MSNEDFNGFGDLGELDSLVPEPTLSPAQKAAETRKKNAAARAAAATSAAVEQVIQPPIAELPHEVRSEEKAYKFKKGEKRWVTLQKERGKGGDRPVPVCVQGRQYTVPRGVKVQIPAMVAEVLKNAEETIVEWDGNSNNDQRVAQSYPIAIHDE